MYREGRCYIKTSALKRGYFIKRRVLCKDVPICHRYEWNASID